MKLSIFLQNDLSIIGVNEGNLQMITRINKVNKQKQGKEILLWGLIEEVTHEEKKQHFIGYQE